MIKLQPGKLCRWRQWEVYYWRILISWRRQYPRSWYCPGSDQAHLQRRSPHRILAPRERLYWWWLWWPESVLVWPCSGEQGHCWYDSMTCYPHLWWCTSLGPLPRHPQHSGYHCPRRLPGAPGPPPDLYLPKKSKSLFHKITKKSSPKKVLQIYSEIWFPDFDSEKWLSSLLSIRLNWNKK